EPRSHALTDAPPRGPFIGVRLDYGNVTHDPTSVIVLAPSTTGLYTPPGLASPYFPEISFAQPLTPDNFTIRLPPEFRIGRYETSLQASGTWLVVYLENTYPKWMPADDGRLPGEMPPAADHPIPVPSPAPWIQDQTWIHDETPDAAFIPMPPAGG